MTKRSVLTASFMLARILPFGRGRMALQNLSESPPGRGRDILRKFPRREEAGGGDLEIGVRRRLGGGPGPADVKRDVIAHGETAVEVEAEELGFGGQLYPPLLHELSGERVRRGFSRLHRAAGKIPSRHVA